MFRSKRTLTALIALVAFSLIPSSPAIAGGNLAHERIQVTTSQLVYQVGDEFTFNLDAYPISNSNVYTWFIYIQRNETGERRYYPDFDEGVITDITGATELFGSFGIPWINNFAMLGAGAWNGNTIVPPVGGIAPGVTEPGMYSLVVELRDPNGFMTMYSARTQFALVDSIEIIDGDAGHVTADTTWTNDKAYLLRHAVFVDDGATLTIERGTVILGESATIGTLVVAQGGKIDAVGTATSPIIMSSDQEVGSKARGDWGGLILNGKAPINVVGGTALGEGDTGAYGGGASPDPEDSSGRLSYVRVEYAGREFSPDNELNGIAFQGVGSGTQVDHIQVHYNQDDGVEFFGGTVNVKYVLLTGNRDDSLDWTEGWTGKVQFVVAQQVGDDADHGFEADNNADNNDLLPRAHPIIYNFTLIGAPDDRAGPESTDGMLLREGTAGKFRNFIVIGFKLNGINIDHASTIQQATLGELSLKNGIVFNNGVAPWDAEAAPFTTELTQVDPLIVDPYDTKYPDYRPVLFSPGYNGQNIELPPDDGFYDANVWFLGGVDPFADWTTGWTNTHFDD